MHFKNTRFVGNNSIGANILMNFWTNLMPGEKATTTLIMYQHHGSLKLTKTMIEGHYKGHWTEDCIFFSMGMHMGLLVTRPVWHFPEKLYESEETLRKCAESALKSVLGDLSHTYFVGNAPMAHMVSGPSENVPDSTSFKKFFFKSQVIATNKFRIGKCKDYIWVTKDELMEFFPEQAEFLNKMIIS
ncbi:39S ribosomal protein L46, mitochondrial [Quillaja saponaria]|uniref:Large ribosomal subunit protein mL46 n=1 Tax=Quillaja saponaria TaxID=32244 RepID=A0AAD7LQD4_QUISA|nr:39S ribosomal protein L46, mitochondrial [Quillaja saponaria]